MKRVCMYCKGVYGYKPGGGVTHGICPQCFSEYNNDLKIIEDQWGGDHWAWSRFKNKWHPKNMGVTF